jgi:CelD/BcsL family acetyltransferase involved in cellulose biosynthesis
MTTPGAHHGGFPAPTPEAQAIRVRMVRVSELDIADYLAWERLSRIASGDSIFAASWFVQSVLAHFDPDQNYRLLIVDHAEGEWLGVLPLASMSHLGRIPFRHFKNLLNANQFIGVPLVRPGDEARFWQTLLDMLDSVRLGSNGVRIAEMPDDHRVTQALKAVCADTRRSIEVIGQKQRAAWRQQRETDTPTRLDPKRQRRLAALERQLGRQHGPVILESVQDQRELDLWVREFLTLEQAGWKGRNRSAVASDPRSASHFRHVAHMGFAAGHFRALTLRAGTRPIAMTSYFIEGCHGFGFKMAFDESYARFAPGILLKRMLMARYSGNAGLYFDSCSEADAAMINQLWPDRRMLSDIVVATGNRADHGRFAAAMSARKIWHLAKFWRKIAALASPF